MYRPAFLLLVCFLMSGASFLIISALNNPASLDEEVLRQRSFKQNRLPGAEHFFEDPAALVRISTYASRCLTVRAYR